MTIISSFPLAVNYYHTNRLIDAGDGFFDLDIIAKQPISRQILLIYKPVSQRHKVCLLSLTGWLAEICPIEVVKIREDAFRTLRKQVIAWLFPL